MSTVRPEVWAHQGASAAHPGNTIEAFVAARRLGAHGVELDVHRTADDALAVHHDAHVADGRLIAETPAADLPSEVPSLAAALDACAPMVVNIEVKNSRFDAGHDPEAKVSDAVVALLAERGDRDRVVASSFDRPSLARIRRLDPTLATAWLVHRVDAKTVASATAAGHRALHPWHAVVDAAVVEAARAAGLALNVWTVDDPARMAELAALGVDAIITNLPDLALEVLAGLP